MGVKIKHMSVNTALMKRLNLHNVRYQQLIEHKKLDLYNRYSLIQFFQWLLEVLRMALAFNNNIFRITNK